MGLIRTFEEGSLAPSSPEKLLVQPTTADLHTSSTLQERRAAATERRTAARAETVAAAARAKAVKDSEQQFGKKRKKHAPGEGCQPINRPVRGMMVELGLAPRCPSPGEITNETETLPDEVHHDTLPGEKLPARGKPIHVFVPTGYTPTNSTTGAGCTAMWTQVAPGEWICHNPSDAVEGIASAHREEPEPELRFVAPMSDISDRNEESQLTATGKHITAGSLWPIASWV